MVAAGPGACVQSCCAGATFGANRKGGDQQRRRSGTGRGRLRSDVQSVEIAAWTSPEIDRIARNVEHIASELRDRRARDWDAALVKRELHGVRISAHARRLAATEVAQ